MKKFTIIFQTIRKLPFTSILKSFVIDIKKIYICKIPRQYIKKSLYLKFIFIFLIKLTANVNNALNINYRLVKQNIKKIQTTYTYEKFQVSKKTHDF